LFFEFERGVVTKSVLVRFATNRRQVGGLVVFDEKFRDKNHPEKYCTGSVTVYQTGVRWNLDYGSLQIDPPSTAKAALTAKASGNDIVAFAQEQSEARKQVKSGAAPQDLGYGIFFLHGFNTSFVRAVEVSAQIAANYNATGVFVFSWPSIGKGVSDSAYDADRVAAAKSAPAIADSLLRLLTFLNQLKASKRPALNIVAHSMGNFALSGAVQIVAKEDPKQIQKDLFEGALLMAADEAQDALSKANSLAPLVKLARRVTSYYSGRDLVLALSQAYNGRVPLGLVKPKGLSSLDKKVTAIDCSDVASTQDENGKTEYGHGYFRGSPWVLNDVRQVLANIAPDKIAGRLKDMTDPAGGRAWWIPYDTGAGRPVVGSAKARVK
jgi:esterase/lipase superfamily enzyme